VTNHRFSVDTIVTTERRARTKSGPRRLGLNTSLVRPSTGGALNNAPVAGFSATRFGAGGASAALQSAMGFGPRRIWLRGWANVFSTPRIGSIRDMTLSDVVNSPAILQFHLPLDIRANPPCPGGIFSLDSRDRNTSSSTFRFANAHGKNTTITSGSDPHIEGRKL